MKSFNDCSHILRGEGFNHTDSNRYARLTGKRKMDWARIDKKPDGDHVIVYL